MFSELEDCLTTIVSCFKAFFDWLVSFNIINSVSYLELLIGAFVLYLLVDNFLLKGK